MKVGDKFSLLLDRKYKFVQQVLEQAEKWMDENMNGCALLW